jgi:hypothetical protein
MDIREATPVSRRLSCSTIGTGIISDVRNRLPFYVSDFRDGFSSQALSAGIFIFFSQAIPATAFASFLSDRTLGQLGVAEVLLSMGIGGVLFSLFAGQPLVIVGVTGPVCILVATISDLARNWNLPLRGWLFASCCWASGFHILLSLFSAPRLFAKSITAFSGDIFGALIGVIYVEQGIKTLVGPFFNNNNQINGTGFDTAILALCLGCGCVLLAALLGWRKIYSHRLHSFISTFFMAYAMPISVIIATSARFIPIWHNAAIHVPLLPISSGVTILESSTTTATLPPWAIAAAALPGFVITALLFFDHNISALMAQSPKFPLLKPQSYDYDFFLLGISIIITGVLGLPPNYGLLPQSPMHTEALCITAAVKKESGAIEFEILSVCENRISNLLQSVLLLALLSPSLMQLLGQVPLSVLGGIFLYLGLTSLSGNGVVKRAMGIIRRWHSTRRATVIVSSFQIILIAGIFGISQTEAGLIFPVCIMGLLPLRYYVLAWLLGNDEVGKEDPLDWGRVA